MLLFRQLSFPKIITKKTFNIMKKILHKLLFAALLVSGSTIYSQTALPGTVEAETGTFGGIVGASGSGVNNLRGGSANFVSNSVTVATAGDYDFTFTYNRSGAAAASVTMEIVDPATGLFSAFAMTQTSGFETITRSSVTLPMGTYDIKFYNANGNGFNLDKYEVTAVGASPTMTSSKDGAWNDPTVWTVSGPVATVPSTTPTAEYDVIVGVGHNIDINDGVNAECLDLVTGGTGSDTDINAGGSLIVNGDITITRFDNGFRVLPSLTKEAPFVLKGNYESDGASKRIIYTRPLDESSIDGTARKWFLVSNPFKSMNKANSVDRFDVFTNTANGDGSLQSLGTYDNSNAAGSKYVYRASADTSGLVDGGGYIVAVNNGGTADITYRGFYDHDTGSTATTALTFDATEMDGFNLVGNPYLSYIHTNALSDATHNIFDDNTGVMNTKTLWVWDGNAATFTPINEATAHSIAPGQGFFVETTAAKEGNLTFDKDLQTITSHGNVLSKTANNRFEIDLSVSVGKLSRKTSILYIDNKTTSFDNGYDSKIFGGFASELEVYTGLVEGGSTKKLGIQSLPNQKFEDMIIPVGVTATANSEITFSAEALNVPTGYKVFLEDRLNNTFTRLDEIDAQYIATVTDKSTDGRFFLHTRSSALSTDTELLNSISIYKSNASTLRIVGLSQGKSTVKLYNVLGKQVMSSSFSVQGVKELSLPTLAKGVYIVQLETENGKLNKKIVLE